MKEVRKQAGSENESESESETALCLSHCSTIIKQMVGKIIIAGVKNWRV